MSAAPQPAAEADETAIRPIAATTGDGALRVAGIVLHPDGRCLPSAYEHLINDAQRRAAEEVRDAATLPLRTGLRAALEALNAAVNEICRRLVWAQRFGSESVAYLQDTVLRGIDEIDRQRLAALAERDLAVKERDLARESAAAERADLTAAAEKLEAYRHSCSGIPPVLAAVAEGIRHRDAKRAAADRDPYEWHTDADTGELRRRLRRPPQEPPCPAN